MKENAGVSSLFILPISSVTELKGYRKYSNKDTNIMRKIISHPDLMIKIFSGKGNFQITAVRMGVCAYMHATVLLLLWHRKP